MIEKTIAKELIFEGRAVSLSVHTVEGPNGVTTREVIDHSPAVTILPFKAPDTLYFVHQFRKPTEKVLIEAPAGCIEQNEDPDIAAKRELQEETGFCANRLEKLGEMYMAPGFCNEYMHIYVAQDLIDGETNFDNDETMELHEYSIEAVKTMIRNRQIIDAKTITGFYLLLDYINESSGSI